MESFSIYAIKVFAPPQFQQSTESPKTPFFSSARLEEQILPRFYRWVVPLAKRRGGE
jgi:hypothetical protein